MFGLGDRRTNHKRSLSQDKEESKFKKPKDNLHFLSEYEKTQWAEIERVQSIPKYIYIGEYDRDRKFMMNEEDKACK